MTLKTHEKPVLIITSGAYIGDEFESEFGKIPPSFLPLGNRRLYTHQHSELSDKVSRIILSIPESFSPDLIDLTRLSELGIDLISVPEHLSLGESIVYVINVSAVSGGALMLLHGDTLLKGLDTEITDAVSVDTNPQPDYQWGGVVLEQEHARVVQANDSDGANAVLTGFFHFSDSTLLVQSITQQHGDFLKGLIAYGKTITFRPLRDTEWFDFGHSGSYHRSRRRVTTERAFNSLITTDRRITKSGVNATKIGAEANWFEMLPNALRIYIPAYLGRNSAGEKISYSLEYLHLPTLADLFVFGRLRFAAWNKIFIACSEVLKEFKKYKSPQNKFYKVDYHRHTLNRLNEFSSVTSIDLEKPCRIAGRNLPSLTEMSRLAASAISSYEQEHIHLIHGDFCFSNILFDSRASLIRTIDPRGIDLCGNISIWGDGRYDIAKFYHSAIGLYDHIIADNFRLKQHSSLDISLELPEDQMTTRIGTELMKEMLETNGFSHIDALAISILLFFSMLPLHSDNRRRQMALMANGMRLFLMLDKKLG